MYPKSIPKIPNDDDDDEINQILQMLTKTSTVINDDEEEEEEEEEEENDEENLVDSSNNRGLIILLGEGNFSFATQLINRMDDIDVTNTEPIRYDVIVSDYYVNEDEFIDSLRRDTLMRTNVCYLLANRRRRKNRRRRRKNGFVDKIWFCHDLNSVKLDEHYLLRSLLVDNGNNDDHDTPRPLNYNVIKLVFNFPHVQNVKMKIHLNRRLLQDTFSSANRLIHLMKMKKKQNDKWSPSPSPVQMYISLCAGQSGLNWLEPKQKQRKWCDSWRLPEQAADGQFVLINSVQFDSAQFINYLLGQKDTVTYYHKCQQLHQNFTKKMLLNDQDGDDHQHRQPNEVIVAKEVYDDLWRKFSNLTVVDHHHQSSRDQIDQQQQQQYRSWGYRLQSKSFTNNHGNLFIFEHRPFDVDGDDDQQSSLHHHNLVPHLYPIIYYRDVSFWIRDEKRFLKDSSSINENENNIDHCHWQHIICAEASNFFATKLLQSSPLPLVPTLIELPYNRGVPHEWSYCFRFTFQSTYMPLNGTIIDRLLKQFKHKLTTMFTTQHTTIVPR